MKSDALHRLSSSTGTFNGKAASFQETYDHFGNRNTEVYTYNGVQNQPSAYLHFTAGNNRIDNGTYDNAGNMLSDGTNNYLYDAENRLCATDLVTTGGGMVGYLYAPDGSRLGKGTITQAFSCDFMKNGMLTSNGLALTTGYSVLPNGDMAEETVGNFDLKHFNVFWEGTILGTFAGVTAAQVNWSFALNDWLGTKRQITNSGANTASFSSGPFGDYLMQSGSGADPSDEHFTGKERDAESGLDYFGARYYGSNMGRFMSPDHAEDDTIPVALPFAELSDPQTLNHYSYAGNNPLRYSDPDGHDYHVCADNGSGGQNCFNLTDDQYASLYKQQNGQQGINLLGGMGGTITCGGAACGSASYFEKGLQDDTMGQIMMFLPLEKLAGPALGALGRIGESIMGRIGGEAAAKAASSVLASGSKAAIRDALENGAVNEAQKGAVKRALARGKMTDTFTIEKLGDGSIKVIQDVAGRAGGHATYEKVIDAAGNTVPGSVVQREWAGGAH